MCLCAGISWREGHHPSLGMMPPQMDATGHPKAFALVSGPQLCPHSPRRTLKRLNPAAQLPPLDPRAGRRCLHIPGMDHPPPQPTRPQPLVPVVLLPRACSSPPLPGDRGQSPQWDVGQGMAFLPQHWGFTGALHGASGGPTSPSGAPCSPPLSPPSGGQCWQLAHHRWSARAACGQRAGARRGRRPGTGGQAGGPGALTPAPGGEQGVGKGVCFPLRGRPWSCFLSALQEP